MDYLFCRCCFVLFSFFENVIKERISVLSCKRINLQAAELYTVRYSATVIQV